MRIAGKETIELIGNRFLSFSFLFSDAPEVRQSSWITVVSSLFNEA